MREMGYPREPHNSYECYILDEEVEVGIYNIFEIVSRARIEQNYQDYTPIFCQCKDMKEYIHN